MGYHHIHVFVLPVQVSCLNLIVIVEGLGEQAASLSKKEDRIQADIEYKLRRFLSS